MVIAAFVVSVIAVIAALGSLIYTRQVSRTARREHDLHVQQDYRERTPRLTVQPLAQQTEPMNLRYVLTLEGPEDLDSVVVKRPRPKNNLVYQLAVDGRSWDDEIEFTPLRIGVPVQFRIAVGNAPNVPEFFCEVTCLRGSDQWTLMKRLEPPVNADFISWSDL